MSEKINREMITDAYSSASTIMIKLLMSKNKVLRKSDEPELFNKYRNESAFVRDYVKDLSLVAGGQVEATDEAIYLIPNERNFGLLYTKAELARELRCGDRDGAYELSMIAITVLITTAYKGASPQTSKVQPFIQPKVWQENIEKTLAELGKTNEEVSRLESIWQAMPNDEEDMDRHNRTKDFLLRNVRDFLVREGLVSYDPDSQIITFEERMSVLVDHYLLNAGNIGRLSSLLKGEYSDE